MPEQDPRKPFIIGIIVLAILMVGGIVWAALSAPEASSEGGRYDANVSFIDDGDPVFGKQDASIVVRIFEDFQCPACKTAQRGVQYLKETYGDRIKIVWNDFPLDSIHPNARLASNAARCAEEQGMFWEYGDLLYEKQSFWSNERSPDGLFVSYANDLGLNESAFTVCLDERRYNQKIQNDASEARANRIDSTPTFFVNNQRYTGVLSNTEWDTAIRAQLGESASPVEDVAEAVETPMEDATGIVDSAEPQEVELFEEAEGEIDLTL